MRTDWTGEDGMKAIERMGWPRNLRVSCGTLLIAFPEVDIGGYDEIMMAILRDKARDWLEKRRIHITPFWNMGETEPAYYARLSDRKTTNNFSDYDEAIIAAVMAAGE